ncbi:MAG: acyl-CoA thioesterase [Acidimicrobiales bacterium]
MSDEARQWLGLEATHNPFRWNLPITPGICTGHRFLFGGCGLGAAIAALEGTTERPVVWATAQYLSYAPVDQVLDLDVVVAVEGRKTTQARVTGHVGGTEILTVNAALGGREYPVETRFPEMPAVQPPEDSPVREPFSDADSLSNRLDQRWAVPVGDPPGQGPTLFGPGRTAVWTRMPGLADGSGAGLAVLGDFVPMGISTAIGRPTMANSLDNTLRVFAVAPSEWFLLDINIEGVARGFGHGFVHIWSQDGVLAAIGSQSAMVRQRPGDDWPPPSRTA